MTYIRVAKDKKDSASASSIYAMSWKAGYKGIFSEKLLSDIPLDFWVDAFNNNYESGRFDIALINVNGEDIGAGGYGLSRDYNDSETGEITSVYFLDKAWGKGYSKPLIDFMMDNLRKKGCKKIHVWVIENNVRARKFYEKCGFSCTGNKKEVTFRGEIVTDIEYAI